MNSSPGFKISFITLDRTVEQSKVVAKNMPRLSDARKLSDEELLAKLESLGIPAGKQWLEERCRLCRSAEELARALCDEHELADQDSNWVWSCLTVLWERWFADVPNLEMIDDLMQLGYQKLEQRDVAGACEAWLSYWQSALKLMERWRIGSVNQFDEQFVQTQCMYDWCQDLELELGNAGIRDHKYLALRLQFCEQIIPLLDPDEPLILGNMRRAIAESHFDLGEEAEAQRLYEEWLAADGRWGWGWIGWSDLYWIYSGRGRDPQRAEQILRRALEVPGLQDRAEVLQRLSDLYEQTGQKEKAREVAVELASITPRSGLDSSAFAASAAAGKQAAYFPAPSSVSPLPTTGSKGKVGRNDPCPCGSGNKYKRCCGA